MSMTLNWQKQRFQCPQQQSSSSSSIASSYQNDRIKNEPETYAQSLHHQQFHAPSHQPHQNRYQTPHQQVIMTPPNSMMMHQMMSPMISGVSMAPIMPTSIKTPVLGPMSATPLTTQFTSANISATPTSSTSIRMTSPPSVYQTVYPPQMLTPPTSVAPVASPSSSLPQELLQNLDSNYLKDILKNISSDAQAKTDGRRDSTSGGQDQTEGRRDQNDNQTASRSDGQLDVNKMSIKQLIDEIPKITKEEQQCKQFKDTLQGKVKDLTEQIRKLKQELDKYSRHLKNQTERYERIAKRKDEVMDAIKTKKDLIPDDLGLQLPSSSDSSASSTSRSKQIVKRSANEAQKAHNKRVRQDVHDVFGGEQQSGVKRSMPVRPGAGARKHTENQQKDNEEDEEESDDNQMINELLQLGENTNQGTDNQDNLNDNSNGNQESQNDDRFKMIIIKKEKEDLNDNSTKTNQDIVSEDGNSKDNSFNKIVKRSDNSGSSNYMVKQKDNAEDNESTSFEHVLIKQEKHDIKNQTQNLSIEQEMQRQVKIKQEKKDEKFKIKQEKKDDHNDDDDDDDGPWTNRILGAVKKIKKENI